ncbi:MAG: flagellar M-ring protein FliF [Spirochaetes bacterium RBG_13_68_11]|nr:MAG: flagellar M-ring protein FliF [Spirochaetes bacterium RBG_13_68_11]
MNEWLKRLLDQALGLWKRWNTTQKVILFGVIGAGILAVVLLTVLSAQPAMEPLISTAITDEDARLKIATKLDELGVRYQLRADNIFYVSDPKAARRAKAILIQEDLIPKGTDPWALFDMERWTITDFERDVNLQRAITQQLEQHILALDDVDNVSVTLVVPETELFSEDQKPTTASVIITPKPGSDFATNRKKVEGVQRLIELAVAGLAAENIVITDQNGLQINDFAGLVELDRLELAKRELKVKQEYENRIRAEMVKGLQNIFGSDRVGFVRIDIDLDTSKVSSKSEEFTPIVMRPDDPKTPYNEAEYVETLPRSTQTQEEHFQGTGYNPEGPAGTEGQTPPAYKDLSNLVGKYDKSVVTRNNEVNKTVTDTEGRPWNINRITAGVGLDGLWKKQYDTNGRLVINPDGSVQRTYLPVTDEEIAKAKKVIQGAIGYDATRGDLVEVQTIPFDRSKQFEEEDAGFRRQMALRRTLYIGLAALGGLLLIALVYRLIAKELERRRRLREEELARQHQAMREAALRTAEEQGVEIELSVEDRARLEMQENAVNMAREHPEDVAQLIRTWLVEE